MCGVNSTSDTIVYVISTFDKPLIQLVCIWKEKWRWLETDEFIETLAQVWPLPVLRPALWNNLWVTECPRMILLDFSRTFP